MNNQNLSLDMSRAIDALSPGNQAYGVGSKLRNALGYGIGFKEAERYYVDAVNGDNGNDGLSWETAFQTIQKGVDVARYLDGTTTVDTAKDHHKYVFVACGQYNEQVVFTGYNIHLIGVSAGNNGTYGVTINQDGAIAATAVISFTGVGLEIAGFCINCDKAIPAILFNNLSDAVHIHHNWIKGDAGKTVTMGISAAMANSIIEDNVISGCIAGINVAAAAVFTNCIIRNNKLTNVTDGIAIANTANPAQSAILNNMVIGSTSSIVNGQATDVIIDGNLVKPVGTDAGSAEGDNTTLS